MEANRLKRKIDIYTFIGCGLLILLVICVLGTVCVSSPELPVGELSAQWAWFAKTSMLFAVCTWLGLLLYPQERNMSVDFHRAVVWVLIVLCGFETFLGLRQLYGFASSNHSLFNLTGSFFNPGPYSGYLAMIFPICLHEWLRLKDKRERSWMETGGCYVSAGVLLLILCVLPAGMSRSAWLAASVSGVWVYGMHDGWGQELKRLWRQYRTRMLGIAVVGFLCLLLGGAALFHLKKDSASGRLLMWKISCRAIAERPITGYGHGNFATAYGAAQEAYFAGGDYSEQEELVAGSPEYAFNEYLQVAVEWGIPTLLCLLLIIGFCLWRGITEGRTGVCGGVISLMVFAFSSYPLQLPVFIVTFAFLLAACVIGRSRLALAVFALMMGVGGVGQWRMNRYESCREWTGCRMLYNSGSYEVAKERYAKLYPELKSRGPFLFEYGHCLHKLKEYEASNTILKEAATRSCDPMILNVIGKNHQQLGNYAEAEKWLNRSTHLLPGRIYPYYLLAKLYAEPDFHQPEKMKRMADIVLTKEPKVQSTAVKEMREEMRKIRTKND